jgi:hypothetical protein
MFHYSAKMNYSILQMGIKLSTLFTIMRETASRDHKKIIQKFLFRYEKPLAYLGWIVFVVVALLQMWKVRGGFITNYGADSIAPLMLYYSARTNKTLLTKLVKRTPSETQTFFTLWFLCVLWEIAQKFDFSGTVLAITRGTFDPWDILTYTLSLLICYYLDSTRFKTNQ